MKDKKSIFIDDKVKIGKNVIIYENCRIEGDCEIADNVTIFPNCFLNNSIIGKGTKIYSSIIENSKIGACNIIGPFCHLRFASLDNFVCVGDFSVLKQVCIEKNKNIEPFSMFVENKELNKLKKDN